MHATGCKSPCKINSQRDRERMSVRIIIVTLCLFANADTDLVMKAEVGFIM